MNVRIASPLRSYTGGAAEVTIDVAPDAVVADAFAELDRRYPGIRFRVVDELGALRPHVNVWADGDRVRELGASLTGVRELTIMQALSGGAG